jgi:hypothetical protein
MTGRYVKHDTPSQLSFGVSPVLSPKSLTRLSVLLITIQIIHSNQLAFSSV